MTLIRRTSLEDLIDDFRSRNATKRICTANAQFYVSTTGSDTSGDGTAVKPFKTLQYAYLWLAVNVDPSGYTVVLNLADGDYEGIFSDDSVGKFSGSILIQGNRSNVAACRIVENDNGCIYLTANSGGQSTVYLNYITIHGTSGNAAAINCYYNNMVSAGGDYINGFTAQAMKYTGTFYAIVDMGYGGRVEIYGNPVLALSVSAIDNFVICSTFGYVWIFLNAMTTNSPLAMNDSFMFLGELSYGLYRENSHSGTFTGKQYDVNTNSVLTKTNTPPGNVSGTTASGGQAV
jgi:hypothetical protein